LPLSNFLRETLKKVQDHFQEKRLAMHSSQLLLDGKVLVTPMAKLLV